MFQILSYKTKSNRKRNIYLFKYLYKVVYVLSKTCIWDPTEREINSFENQINKFRSRSAAISTVMLFLQKKKNK